MAICLKAQKKINDSAQEYRAALRYKPKDVGILISVAELLREGKLLDEAEKEAGLAVQYGPNNADAHMTLATVLMAKKQDSRAIKEFETTLKLKPDHPHKPYITQYLDYLRNRRI